ncbi:MAG: hypothetical protein MHM6MM_004393 [Cercozoa sp. M6MM]
MRWLLTAAVSALVGTEATSTLSSCLDVLQTTLAGETSLGTLVAQHTGLRAMFEASPVTIFAPSDSAIAAAGWSDLPLEQLAPLVQQHVVFGRSFIASDAFDGLVGVAPEDLPLAVRDLVDPRVYFLESELPGVLLGARLEASAASTADFAVFNTKRAESVAVSRADVECANGVVHVLDGVLPVVPTLSQRLPAAAQDVLPDSVKQMFDSLVGVTAFLPTEAAWSAATGTGGPLHGVGQDVLVTALLGHVLPTFAPALSPALPELGSDGSLSASQAHEALVAIDASEMGVWRAYTSTEGVVTVLPNMDAEAVQTAPSGVNADDSALPPPATVAAMDELCINGVVHTITRVYVPTALVQGRMPAPQFTVHTNIGRLLLQSADLNEQVSSSSQGLTDTHELSVLRVLQSLQSLLDSAGSSGGSGSQSGSQSALQQKLGTIQTQLGAIDDEPISLVIATDLAVRARESSTNETTWTLDQDALLFSVLKGRVLAKDGAYESMLSQDEVSDATRVRLGPGVGQRVMVLASGQQAVQSGAARGNVVATVPCVNGDIVVVDAVLPMPPSLADLLLVPEMSGFKEMLDRRLTQTQRDELVSSDTGVTLLVPVNDAVAAYQQLNAGHFPLADTVLYHVSTQLLYMSDLGAQQAASLITKEPKESLRVEVQRRSDGSLAVNNGVARVLETSGYSDWLFENGVLSFVDQILTPVAAPGNTCWRNLLLLPGASRFGAKLNQLQESGRNIKERIESLVTDGGVTFLVPLDTAAGWPSDFDELSDAEVEDYILGHIVTNHALSSLDIVGELQQQFGVSPPRKFYPTARFTQSSVALVPSLVSGFRAYAHTATLFGAGVDVDLACDGGVIHSVSRFLTPPPTAGILAGASNALVDILGSGDALTASHEDANMVQASPSLDQFVAWLDNIGNEVSGGVTVFWPSENAWQAAANALRFVPPSLVAHVLQRQVVTRSMEADVILAARTEVQLEQTMLSEYKLAFHGSGRIAAEGDIETVPSMMLVNEAPAQDILFDSGVRAQIVDKLLLDATLLVPSASLTVLQNAIMSGRGDTDADLSTDAFVQHFLGNADVARATAEVSDSNPNAKSLNAILDDEENEKSTLAIPVNGAWELNSLPVDATTRANIARYHCLRGEHSVSSLLDADGEFLATRLSLRGATQYLRVRVVGTTEVHLESGTGASVKLLREQNSSNGRLLLASSLLTPPPPLRALLNAAFGFANVGQRIDTLPKIKSRFDLLRDVTLLLPLDSSTPRADTSAMTDAQVLYHALPTLLSARRLRAMVKASSQGHVDVPTMLVLGDGNANTDETNEELKPKLLRVTVDSSGTIVFNGKTRLLATHSDRLFDGGAVHAIEGTLSVENAPNAVVQLHVAGAAVITLLSLFVHLNN